MDMHKTAESKVFAKVGMWITSMHTPQKWGKLASISRGWQRNETRYIDDIHIRPQQSTSYPPNNHVHMPQIVKFATTKRQGRPSRFHWRAIAGYD
ncbi:hypothetical protein, partial [Bifidobacterium sp. UBA6881]|uniref:hypothetical protein n=1 Tax=Bifidobacterium sp. UBA6881 TaxID=1946109 RepID=UPI0025B9DC8E